MISLASVVACVAVGLAGRVRLERPDLERYVEEGEPGLESRPFGAALPLGQEG